MHEFSIAEALLERVRTHLPQDALLKSVTVRVGLFRRIDPDAMQMAWQAITREPCLENSQLILQEAAGDELVLLSLDVDPMTPDAEVQHAHPGG